MDTPYHIGEVVHWTSQANGVSRTKTGTVVGIVPAGYSPMFAARREAIFDERYYTNSLDYNRRRITESYLIAVSMRSPAGHIRKRQKLYWPIVNLLRPGAEVPHTPLSLREARTSALQVLAETERSLHEDRLADAARFSVEGR